MFTYFIPLTVNLTKNSKLEKFVHELNALWKLSGSSMGALRELVAVAGIQPQMLMRHFGVAMRQAKDYFNQGHSSKQSSAGKEEIPAWACQFFWYFNAMESNPSASAQAAELATDRSIVVNSIMGQQAPLEPHQGTQPVQLWTKM